MATTKQKIAILNLLSYLRTGDKNNWTKIEISEANIIDNLSFEKASKQIDKLIWDVKDRDEELRDNSSYYDTYYR